MDQRDDGQLDEQGMAPGQDIEEDDQPPAGSKFGLILVLVLGLVCCAFVVGRWIYDNRCGPGLRVFTVGGPSRLGDGYMGVTYCLWQGMGDPPRDSIRFLVFMGGPGWKCKAWSAGESGGSFRISRWLTAEEAEHKTQAVTREYEPGQQFWLAEDGALTEIHPRFGLEVIDKLERLIEEDPEGWDACRTIEDVRTFLDRPDSFFDEPGD